jgi:amino acid transporter
VFAEYTLASFGSPPSPSRAIFSPVRLVAFACLTGVFLLHGLHIPAGIRLQNVLGFMKIGILLFVVGTGFIALSGNLQEGVPRPGNFDSWERIWAGSTTGGSALCTCLYNVRLYLFTQFTPTIDFLRSYTASTASVMPITPSPKSTTLLERFG